MDLAVHLGRLGAAAAHERSLQNEIPNDQSDESGDPDN